MPAHWRGNSSYPQPFISATGNAQNDDCNDYKYAIIAILRSTWRKSLGNLRWKRYFGIWPFFHIFSRNARGNNECRKNASSEGRNCRVRRDNDAEEFSFPPREKTQPENNRLWLITNFRAGPLQLSRWKRACQTRPFLFEHTFIWQNDDVLFSTNMQPQANDTLIEWREVVSKVKRMMTPSKAKGVSSLLSSFQCTGCNKKSVQK